MLNLLAKSALKCYANNYLTASSFRLPQMQCSFSSYFNLKDQEQMTQYQRRHSYNKKYRQLIARWKKPLQRKRLRRQRMKPIWDSQTRKQSTHQKLVVHNPAVGIQYPPKPYDIFCVIKIDQKQFKVTKDCLIVLDTKQSHDINQQIIFKEVLLVGTPTYTVIGRPIVETTNVRGMIESIQLSQKVIVFKKKRRKQYSRSFGHRSQLTSVRIHQINHQLSDLVMSKAVSLIQ